jgi:hypothetical protein
MNTWKRTSNNSTQGGKKRLLLGGLVLGLVSLCNGMGHSKLLAPDLHPTQAGMGRRGNIFAQLTTRQLESGASKKLTQQDAGSALVAPAEAPTVAKSADLSGETESAAKVEEAVIAITKELNDPTSTSAPVTNSVEVIPPTVTEASTTPVENAAEEECIDFSAPEEEESKDEEVVHEAAVTASVEGANLDTPASAATIDEINNSAGNSLEL